jgi:uncharacterized membrane protein
MERRKLVSAALVITLFGALLFTQPIATVFELEYRILGVPAEVIYLFAVWIALVVGAWWLGHSLPHEDEEEG